MEQEEHELRQLGSQSDSNRTVDDSPMNVSREEDDTQVGAMPSDVVDSALDRRVVRKLDFILLPFLALLFLFNSLDKSNIGNAETANFTQDIGLSRSDLNAAVAVFFAVFVTLQPVGAALGRRYGMATYVPACMSIWGVCTALHVWVRSKGQLILLRVIIGALESGFYPVTVSYLSLFYTKFEFARRLAVFYGQSAVAGAFGGVLSYCVFSWFPSDDTSVAESTGWKSWQVLFMVEGCCTIVLALAGFFWLPHSASTAWFLQPDERAWAEERITLDSASNVDSGYRKVSVRGDPEQADDRAMNEREDQGLLGGSREHAADRGHDYRKPTEDRGLSTQEVLSAVLDWKVWYLLACNILSAIPVTAFSVFLPLVLQPLTNFRTKREDGDESDGVTKHPALTNLLTAPPFILGAVVLFLFTSYSDRHRTRLFPMLVGLGILLTGLTLTTLLPRSWVVPRYLSLCIMLSGSFIASPLQVAWLSNNIPQAGKRSIVLGINGWGNLAGVFSAWLFQPKFAPDYQVPFFITFALVSVAWAAYSAFRFWLVRDNAKRDGEGMRTRKVNSLLVNVLVACGLNRLSNMVEEVREKELEDERRLDFRYGL